MAIAGSGALPADLTARAWEQMTFDGRKSVV